MTDHYDKAAAYKVARAECFAWIDAAAAVDSIGGLRGTPTTFVTAYNAKLKKVGSHLNRMVDLAEHRAEKARKAAAVEPVICAICSTDYDKRVRRVCPYCYCERSLPERKK